MNIKHRALGVSAVGVLTVVLLAGCGSGSSAGSGPGDGSQAANTVTVWHYFSADKQVEVLNNFKEKFEAENKGVTVKDVFVAQDQFANKVINAASSQNGPDIVLYNGGEFAAFAVAGAIKPIDDEWASFQDADQFPDAAIHRIDDKVYTVQGYTNLLGLWCNSDKLDELGLKAPTTLEELETAMAAAKKVGLNGLTLAGLVTAPGEWQAYPWLSSQGFDYESPDEAALAKGFAMVRSWVEKGYVSKEVTTWDQNVPFSEFLAGKSLCAANGNWQITNAEANADFAYTVVPLPIGDSGKVYLGGESPMIGAFSKNPKLAWKYLESTFYSVEGQLSAAKTSGYIPTRADAAQEPAIADDELLAPFLSTVKERGASYPSSALPADSVFDVQTTVGEAWNAALGGQQSPQQAAKSVMSLLDSLSR